MRSIVLACSLLSATVVWADKYTPLNVKLGQWETKITSKQMGGGAIPPSLAAKLTPDQIARYQQMMKARSASGPTTRTHHGCLTQEDLAKGPTWGQGKGCDRSIITSTSKKEVTKVTCNNDGMQEIYNVTVTANSPESVTGKVHIVASAGGKSDMSDATITAKWLGSTCTKKD